MLIRSTCPCVLLLYSLINLLCDIVIKSSGLSLKVPATYPLRELCFRKVTNTASTSLRAPAGILELEAPAAVQTQAGKRRERGCALQGQRGLEAATRLLQGAGVCPGGPPLRRGCLSRTSSGPAEQPCSAAQICWGSRAPAASRR